MLNSGCNLIAFVKNIGQNLIFNKQIKKKRVKTKQKKISEK